MTPPDTRHLIDHPRYTERPFPPYRFTPGRDPHPAADPRGHSYEPPGHVRPAAVYRSPEAWRECGEYLYGCDLYNHAYWWEAHEAWEDLWRVVPVGSVQRHFLQGLIQVSACHLKLYLAEAAGSDSKARAGHLAGVERLRASSMMHLSIALNEASIDRYMGLSLAPWAQSAVEYFARAVSSGQPAHSPMKFPFIGLPVKS